MTPQSAKAKGRALQQWVRDLILRLGFNLTERDVKSTSMGAGGEDVLLSEAAVKQFPLSIECKNLAKFAGYRHLEQAQSNCPKDCQPIAVIRANRKTPIVLVDAEYFFTLVKGTKWTKNTTKR